MKVSKRESLLLIVLLCVFAAACVWLELAKPVEQESALSVKALDRFLEEGKVLSLAAVFPFEWDEVLIANAPERAEGFFADLREYDPAFVPLNGVYFLVIFYFEGKVADYFQYTKVADDVVPFFVENRQLEYGWVKQIPRDKALFYGDGIRGEAGVFLCTLIPEV